MNFDQINFWAIITAALSTFVLGGLWYSPLLFGKVWMCANGFTEQQVRGFKKARAFGGSFVFALIMALNPVFTGCPVSGRVGCLKSYEINRSARYHRLQPYNAPRSGSG